MAEVRIQKVDTRYRLPHSLRAEQRRLDQLTTRVIEAACAETLTRLGLPEDSEVCLRDVFVPVSLRLNRPDKSLVDDWSNALAREIAAAIRNGSTRTVVVYQSRRQALIDLAESVACGDLRRCWAWRQLGLWKSSAGTSEAQATVELVNVLCSEPEIIVPTFSALATSGALKNLARRLMEQQWQALAAAALGETNATRFLKDAIEAPAAPVLSREAVRVIDRSLLLRSLTTALSFSEAREPVRKAIAVLAVLEVHPVLMQRESAAMLIAVIAGAIGKREAASDIEQSSPAESQSTDPTEQIASEDLAAINKSVNRETGTSAQRNEPGDDRPPLDLRQRAFTRWGGLLFLLGVLEDLKLPEAILDQPLLGTRDFSWTLHQLALAVTGTDPNDPAALAFAGLSPNAKPPSTTEAPANESELAALRQFLEIIIERLRLLVEVEPEVNVIEFVCRRRAQLVVDPGWIEVRLSLDEVSTEVRCAGLDLNPGYISWLGVVVSFVYE